MLVYNVMCLLILQKWKVLGAAAGGIGALVGALEFSIWASGTEAKPYKHQWGHSGPLSSFDHAR